MTTIKENFLEGMENVGRSFPIIGKIVGSSLVFKSMKKLKPIKIKGAVRL